MAGATPISAERLGELAIQMLKSWGRPFDPKSYEVAYKYVEGSSGGLNRAIDEITKSGGALSGGDITRLRDRYISPELMLERIAHVGEKLENEVDQVVGMIESAIGISSDYCFALQGSRETLGSPIDHETLRTIIAAVLSLTQDVQQENLALSSRLQRSQNDISKLQSDLITIRAESLSDPLTGAANRKHLDQFLVDAIKRAHETRQPLSFLLVDVDHFKAFNDNCGHLTGDQILRFIAETLQMNLKGTDLVARYGGEEFAVVLPNTNQDHARVLAENLRRKIAGTDLMKRSTGENLGRITVSIGISNWHAGQNAQALIGSADAYLYEAKRRGRNCVVF